MRPTHASLQTFSGWDTCRWCGIAPSRLHQEKFVKCRITQLAFGGFFCDMLETSLQRHVRNDSGRSRQQPGEWNGERDVIEQACDF